MSDSDISAIGQYQLIILAQQYISWALVSMVYRNIQCQHFILVMGLSAFTLFVVVVCICFKPCQGSVWILFERCEAESVYLSAACLCMVEASA